MEWGAIALYKATRSGSYLDQALSFATKAGPAHDTTSVYNTHALAHFLLAPHVSPQERERLVDYLRVDAEFARSNAVNPYRLGTPYTWGTAEAAAGAALSCLLYARLTHGIQHNQEYVALARHQRDFILGCNPVGIRLDPGGARYPLFPASHQIANITSRELSGAIVGGPTDIGMFQKEQNLLTDGLQSGMISGPPLPEDDDDAVRSITTPCRTTLRTSRPTTTRQNSCCWPHFTSPERQISRHCGARGLPV